VTAERLRFLNKTGNASAKSASRHSKKIWQIKFYWKLVDWIWHLSPGCGLARFQISNSKNPLESNI